MNVLVTAELCREEMKRYEPELEIDYKGYCIDHEVLDHGELKKRIPKYDILICEYDTIDKEIIDAAKNLQLIICCRGGVSSVVDIPYCREKGITVCHNLGRNAEAVAELVLGYMIGISRNILSSHQAIFSGKINKRQGKKPKEYKDTVWGLDNDSPFIRYRGKSLKYMTLGIVGYGSVGRKVAEKAMAFGMKIIAYDPLVKEIPLPVEAVSLDELLARADFVSLHCGVTEATKGMIDQTTIQKMKDGAVLINTARGELLDEEALVEALKNHKLSGAALDVTRQEPIPDDSVLLTAPNLILTPHIAGSSDDVQVVGTQMVVESLDDYLLGSTMRHEVK